MIVRRKMSKVQEKPKTVKKPKTYKQLMRQILKPKISEKSKDEKTIKNNTGGGKFTQVEKI